MPYERPLEGDWVIRPEARVYTNTAPPKQYRLSRWAAEEPPEVAELGTDDNAREEVMRRAQADGVNAWWEVGDDIVPLGGFRTSSPVALPNWVKLCPSCDRGFAVTGDRGGPFQEREDIDCPYCGTTVASKRTAGVFQTHPLSNTQQAEWDKRGRPEHP